ncbi:unnamed protein product [marine sediment metagenome]|uniref:Uncharacterized protein n=1 Tax=marine sediment metagenome TaxID=412755 RepID=X1GIK6_9ZZZZ
MFYKYSLEIPQQTLESDPVEMKITLPNGVITEVNICFPDGCFGLAKVKIIHNEFQIFPTNPEKWFAWNNYCISFKEDYKLPENFNLLKLKGYNDDDSYSHTIVFRFGVKGEWRLAFEALGEEVII